MVDKQAWIEAAVARYERPLLHYALGFTGDLHLARDVVQDTFLKLCEADPAHIDAYLAPWLYKVCRNRALNLRQKEKRMTSLDETATHMAAPDDGVAAAMRDETHQRVLAIVGGLPQEQQEAFRLKFRDGLNYREISDILGVSLGTVSNWIAAALNAVRRDMRSDLDLAQED